MLIEMAKKKIFDWKKVITSLSWRVGSLAIIGMLAYQLIEYNGFDVRPWLMVSFTGLITFVLAYFLYKREKRVIIPFQLSKHFRVWYLVAAIVVICALLSMGVVAVL